MPAKTVVTTGAFSYTRKYATRLLLDRGYKVRTLTSHPQRASEFAGQVETLLTTLPTLRDSRNPSAVLPVLSILTRCVFLIVTRRSIWL
jgi:hypothetical protein